MLYFNKVYYCLVFIGLMLSGVVHAGSYDDFFKALLFDDVRVVKSLLQRGFDPNSVNPNGEYALILAIKTPSPRVALALLESPETKVEVRTLNDESPLMLAALKGNLELCKQLIARDADVNKTGWAPLHYAASGGFPEIVELLTANYAYVDAESPNGTTPLMMAAMYGNAASVKALLDAGADPTLKNSLGLSALDFAQKVDRADSAKLISESIQTTKR